MTKLTEAQRVPMGSDVFFVLSCTADGLPRSRAVIAADDIDARTTHNHHYPTEQIIRICQ